MKNFRKSVLIALISLSVLLSACTSDQTGKDISTIAIETNGAYETWNGAIDFMCQPEMGATSAACK
jgi:predicted small secreted protein